MATVSSSRSTAMTLERLTNIAGTLGPLLKSNVGSFFRFVPTLTKYLLCLLLLANVRSWPLGWHFRVFRPVFRVRLQQLLLQWRTMFKSRAAKIQAEDVWLDSITPVGGDPLKHVIKYNTWASLDESDFNGHLSNSSYAKTLDAARFKAALELFPMLFRAGGWIALAATHYNFIREIPMLASYEIRMSTASWDQKWYYIVCKFVTKPKSSKKVKPSQPTPQDQPSSDSESNDALFKASLRTPADEISSTPTPFPANDSPAGFAQTTNTETTNALRAVTASLASEPEPDGATLHTICVSQLCFKIGRITVPPALVLAINGFSVPGPSTASVYSRTNPPPHWAQAKAVMSKPLGGSTKKLQALLRGGWRDVPQTDRWWETALGGVIEEKRAKNLEIVKGLTTGLAGTRNL